MLADVSCPVLLYVDCCLPFVDVGVVRCCCLVFGVCHLFMFGVCCLMMPVVSCSLSLLC